MRKTRKPAKRAARKRKATAPRRRGKAKRCRHTHANFEQIRNRERIFVRGCYAIFDGQDPHFGYGENREILGAHCADCGERLPVGPSSDSVPAVQVEMRAAELADPGSAGKFQTAELWGNQDHCDGGDIDDDDMDDADKLGYLAGWLVREMSVLDDGTAWSWDPKRPIAGQYEEWLRAAEREASTPSRHLDGWVGSGDPPTVASEADVADFDLQAGGLGMTTAEILAAYFEVPPALPADGDLSKLPVLNLDAMEYEMTRDAEPDCRDEDGPEVERIMAEMEGEPGPAMKRYLDHEADAACRRIPTLDETLDRQAGVMRGLAEVERRERDGLTAEEATECAAQSGSDVCQACGDKWTVHGQTCSGSAAEVNRG